MNKGFWLTAGLLVLLAFGLYGLRSMYDPAITAEANTAGMSVDTDENNKIMMNLEKFSGYHNDAEILSKELVILKTDTERAVATKDSKLVGIAANNIYRVLDNVSVNRIPTIEPFEVCDEALDTLSLYAISAKAYYANTNKTTLKDINDLKTQFDTKFAQCQSIVNDKPVEALYQDYQ